MDKLTKLAIKYKTDKWGKHHYTPHYYKMFQNKAKRKKVKKVLEIGVGEGAGLRMFRDFFSNAIVYGAEVDEKRVFIEDGVQIFRCDQTNEDDLLWLVQKTGIDLDLIIDDGSHKPKDQVFTCLTLLLAMKKGCAYVIEDVADLSILEPIKKYFNPEVVHCGKRYDDRLVIIKK